RLPHGSVHRGPVGHVATDRHRLAARDRDLFDQGIEQRLAPGDHHDRVACSRQAPGQAAPDARRCAGDDRHTHAVALPDGRHKKASGGNGWNCGKNPHCIRLTADPSQEECMQRYTSAVVVALFTALVLAAPALAGNPAAGFTDTLVVDNLDQPTAIAFLPDSTLLVTEQGGNLELFDGNNTTTLVSIPVCTGSELGLLGIALDPNFGTNGFIYLYRSNGPNCGSSTNRFNEVVRVTMSGGSISLGSLSVLLSGIRTDNGNHNGGVLRIGPDNKLYVGAGDSGIGDNQGAPGSSTNPYSQDLTSLNGKVLRLNLDGSAPGDNPFVGMGSDRGEIWAYGFRNPFRMSFDDSTGKLWIGDVGDSTVEEVDIGVSGGNYSWPRCEGNLQGPPNSPQPCVVGSDVAPVFTYPHSGGTSLGTCIIGGAFAGS